MRYVRYRDLRTKFGITFSRLHLRRLIAAGKFPPPVHLGPGTVAWLEEDLLEFGRRILAERDQRSSAWRDEAPEAEATTATTREAMIRKITALLAKTTARGATEPEAAAAAAKAAELMTAYAIEVAADARPAA